MSTRRFAIAISAFWILTLSARIFGDSIELHDGRMFEGQIIQKNDEGVKFDAKLGRTRATLLLLHRDIKKIQEKKLPPEFFDPEPAAARISKPSLSSLHTLYLEVPIVGVVGKHIYADSLAKVFSYAKRHRIKHIVLYIDSIEGEVDEALAIYDLFKKYNDSIAFHGIIKNCIGGAMAAAVWCDTLHIMPGSKIGGVDRDLSKASEELQDDDEVIRSQLVYEIIRDTGADGRAADMIRAMLNPAETLYAWKDKNGDIRTDAYRPENVPAKSLVIKVDAGKLLQLRADQAAALGNTLYRGSAQGLGDLLEISDWKAESNYGHKTVQVFIEKREKSARKKQNSFDKKVVDNIAKRKKTDQYMNHSLKSAAKWDPSKASYSKYSSNYNWGRGWSTGYSSNKLTRESQKKWRDRSDASMHYLRRAGKAMGTMLRLEREARKMGLETTYKEGELELMINDIQTKYTFLKAYRNKKKD